MTNDLIARQRRADNIQLSINLAHKLRPLLDPAVQDMMRRHELTLIDATIAANDDDIRREAASAVRAWRNLQSMIATTVQGQARAENKMKDLIDGK